MIDWPVPAFATCGKGIEPFLGMEMKELEFQEVEIRSGGVAFKASRSDLYRANLCLRTAIRVLLPLVDAVVASSDDLYEMVGSFDWTRIMTPDQTLAVDANVRDSAITHSQYAARRVKDAICDQFVRKVGRRPSVNPQQPSVALNLHVSRNRAVVSLDSSGSSLHKRGYRVAQPAAPLAESLASALVAASGWPGTLPLVDPFCGSGTIGIEGAFRVLGIPPGLTRSFAFQGWREYRADVFSAMREKLRSGNPRPELPPILLSDWDDGVVKLAASCVRAAGLGHRIKPFQADARELALPSGPPGWILTNPPFGERIGEAKSLRNLYRQLGERIAAVATGWRVGLFTSDASLAASFGQGLGLASHDRVAFFHGSLACVLWRYSLA
ncbi:MAG: RNA methyltransferase [Planctomycetes bacterium]|nr:RNA methyltransferase [Planctomycetota bacterium]